METEPKLVLFIDTAWIHLNVHVHPQNNRYGSKENPMVVHEVPTDDVYVGVWCAMSASRITGPNFSWAIHSHLYVHTEMTVEDL
jgi:hypothetical protein